MAVTWIVTKIDDEGDFLSVFGQLLFSNTPTNYPTGGDGALTVNLDRGTAGTNGVDRNTAGLPVYLKGQTKIHATLPAHEFNIQSESGTHIPVFVVGTGALNFKIKQIVTATGAELAAGAYPASVTGAVFNYLTLKFKKNR